MHRLERPGPVHRLVTVVENVPVARDTYRLRLADADDRRVDPARSVRHDPAGCGGASDPLLGRPLALYDVVRDASGVADRLRRRLPRVGRGTAALAAARPGERLSVWGPLGNGFGPPPSRTGHLRGRRHRPDAVPGPGSRVAGRAGLTAVAAPDRRPRCSTASGRPRSWPGSTTSARRGSTSRSRPMTARPATMGSSPICWPAGWNAASGRRRSSAAGRRRCWPRSPG